MDDRWPEFFGRMSRNPGAAEEAIARLQAAARVPVPDDYLAFLRWCNGAEGEIGPNYIRFDAAEDVANREYGGYVFEEFVPGLWFIGGDGAEALFAFDTRRQPMPIVATHHDDLDLETLVTVAPSFSAFLELLASEDWIAYWSAQYLSNPNAEEEPTV
jgi:hypothetical protein